MSPGVTFKALLIAHDVALLSQWDHTASIQASIHALSCVVISAVSKAKPKPKPASYFNPYRKRKREGLQITHENFNMLRVIGEAACK